MTSRPIKQCSLKGIHAEHGWLDQDGAPVYSRCDGVTPMTAANEGWLVLIPQNNDASDMFGNLTEPAKLDLIRAAVNVGARVGDRLKLQWFEEGTGITRMTVPHVDVDPDGWLALAHLNDQTPIQSMPLRIDQVPYSIPDERTVKPPFKAAKITEEDQTEALRFALKNILPKDLTREVGNDTRLPVATRVVPSRRDRIETATVSVAVDDTFADMLAGIPRDSDLAHILMELLPEIDAHLRIAGQHYGYETHRDLGMRGQYCDLYRKFIVLRRTMWDGEETTRESLREILRDLIGHSLLTIAMIDRPEGK